MPSWETDIMSVDMVVANTLHLGSQRCLDNGSGSLFAFALFNVAAFDDGTERNNF